MPFRSEKQRKFMWAKHPDIARRWAHEYGSAVAHARKKKKEHTRDKVTKKGK